MGNGRKKQQQQNIRSGKRRLHFNDCLSVCCEYSRMMNVKADRLLIEKYRCLYNMEPFFKGEAVSFSKFKRFSLFAQAKAGLFFFFQGESCNPV